MDLSLEFQNHTALRVRNMMKDKIFMCNTDDTVADADHNSEDENLEAIIEETIIGVRKINMMLYEIYQSLRRTQSEIFAPLSVDSIC